MRTTYRKNNNKQDSEDIVLYKLYFDSNIDILETKKRYEREIETYNIKNSKEFKKSRVENFYNIVSLEKGKLGIRFFPKIFKSFKNHSRIVITPKKKIIIRYRTDNELLELIKLLQLVIVTENDEPLSLVVDKQIIPSSILKLDYKLNELRRKRLEWIQPRKDGNGVLVSSIHDGIKHFDLSICKLSNELFEKNQDRIEFVKGQVWSETLENMIIYKPSKMKCARALQ